MKELVIDASVILKWYLPDEEFTQKALNILHRHVSGETALYAPTILPYEILNALLVAERRGRVKLLYLWRALSTDQFMTHRISLLLKRGISILLQGIRGCITPLRKN
jgi:predicted nucleic acid-binding protein